jgi:hypothetical protein
VYTPEQQARLGVDEEGKPVEQLPVAAPPPAPSCGIGGNGNFDLTVNKITRGGTTQEVISCSPFDIVEDVCERCSPQFEAELRHHGEFDNQPKDLTLLDVGISQPMEVDLQISCFPRAPEEVELLEAPPMSPIQQAAIEQLFNEIDLDGDGSISRSEFQKACTGKRKDTIRDMFEARNLDWKAVFKKTDTDHNGQISLDEFIAGCGKGADAPSAVQIPVSLVVANQTHEELKPMMCGGISGGNVNCQAAQDIAADLRSGVGFFLNNNGLNNGQELDRFDIVEYSSQVVAGTMHHVKVDIGKADILSLSVFECLPCNRNPGGPRFEIKHLELGAFSKRF